MIPFKTLFASSALALAVGVSLASPAFGADAELPKVQQSGNVSYVSGGVSEEDRAALEPLVRDFNLKLVFALRNGEYLSDTSVSIAAGRSQPVLDARSAGPWFFARLPSGQYTVTATSNGQTQRKTVSVGSRGLKTLDFRWNASDGEGTPRR